MQTGALSAEAASEGETVVLVRWAVDWWASLDEMQQFSARYCARRFAGEQGDRARMASHELLENAMRYAIPGSELVYALRETKTGFAVDVANQAVSARLACLVRCVERIREADAEEAYCAAVRRLMADERAVSNGIGLLRLTHEAKVEISAAIDGLRVQVTAHERDDRRSTGRHRRVRSTP